MSRKAAQKKKRRQKRNLGVVEVVEIDRFGVHFKEVDLARIQLEREGLAFEQEKAVMDRLERETECEE